jgi:hypothetical protein
MHLPSAGEILLRKKRVRRNALLLNSFDSARIHSGLTANEEGQVRIGIKDELTIFSQLCGVLLLLLEELHVHRANTPALCGVYELEVETVTRLVGGDPTTSDILPALFERRMSTGRGRPGTNLTNIHEIMFRFVLCE